MIEGVWIISGALAAVAFSDKRARPLLAVLCLVVIQQTIAEAVLADRVDEIAMKVPIDLVCGWMACKASQRTRWQLVVPILFAVTLLAHGAFWLGRLNGFDLWFAYAHVLNVLFIAQLAALASPTGGRLVGYVGAWARHTFAWRRWSDRGDSSPAYESANERDRPAHVRAGSDVFLSSGARV